MIVRFGCPRHAYDNAMRYDKKDPHNAAYLVTIDPRQRRRPAGAL
jgi:hypothetical protein